MESEPKLQLTGLVSGIILEGVEFHLLNEHNDPRGSFTEIFQKHWESCIDPVQWSVVKSEPNVFRGMHYHDRHDEYFCLISGRCVVGLKDVRTGSPTFENFSLYEFNGDDPAALTFPRGILHGWYFFEPSLHIQSVSESYKDYHTDDNFGCSWDDKDLGIPWPFEKAIISERAANFDTYEKLILRIKK